MPNENEILDLYIQAHLKKNPNENEDDLRKRLTISENNSDIEGATKEKSFTLEEARLKNKQAYMPWTDELDTELMVMFIEGRTQKEMGKHFGRTSGAIRSRIKKLDLNGE
ncbi:MAG: hypothetical protein GX857_06790 [Bacteroidales bacterium]|nr:hypothetical protein [Bacteroidales bacterium]